MTDWRDALPLLRAGHARRELIRACEPRSGSPRPPRDAGPETLAVAGAVEPRRAERTREWRAVVRGDPRLRALGGTSLPDPARFRSTIRADLFEAGPYGTSAVGAVRSTPSP